MKRPLRFMIRAILASVCVVAGALATQYLYASREDAVDSKFYMAVFIAAGISFVLFTVLRIQLTSDSRAGFLGCVGSYLIPFLTLFVLSIFTGGAAEFVMWSPIILLFGSLFFTPVVITSYWASVIMTSDRLPMPESSRKTTIDTADVDGGDSGPSEGKRDDV